MTDLTCCRGLFAAWVFAYHLRLHVAGGGAPGPLGAVFARGYLGVDAFFLLSGLVLAHAHPALPVTFPAAGRFWLKRLLRIYPVHLATIFLLALVVGLGAALGFAPRDPGRFGGGELARHLLLLQGWGLSRRWAWNYPSWSISTEWAGYLAFPLLWLGVRAASARGCVLLLGAMLAVLAWVDAAHGPVGLNLTFEGALQRFFPEFVAGMAAVRLLTEHPARLGSARALGLAGLLLTGAALAAGPDWLVVAGLWLLLAGLLAAAGQGRAPVLARVPLLRAFGDLSYPFYMSIAVVETVLAFAWRRAGGVGPADRPVLFVVATGLLTLGLALVLRAAVEQPALRWGRARPALTRLEPAPSR